ncbi:hypothetical protein IAQ61_001904 [Plenodomus lingam]|uniref:uncharacterized protein n=1 Tax=Leptosphaeria maculans TaxID=5022 RepID=UPI003317D791|nr:hypothetical protein IAQ61_001904 [Plenodomus lingam]
MSRTSGQDLHIVLRTAKLSAMLDITTSAQSHVLPMHLPAFSNVYFSRIALAGGKSNSAEGACTKQQLCSPSSRSSL